jgi:aryl-alcohol dehydrogenase-like predicted oxidoreductase
MPCYYGPVENVKFGRTGLFVSRLCLGTGTFGYQCDEPTSVAIMEKAFDSGINFFDTSNGYPIGGGLPKAGTTEEIVGRWLKGKREDVIVGTKCTAVTGSRPWQRGNSRKAILDQVEGSLRRLQTDYIDLYQLHFYDPDTPADEVLSTLDGLVRAGKVRYVGCSNYLAYQVALALGRSELLRLSRFESVQLRYNLLFREFERELIPLCADQQLAVTAFNPLAVGMLTGTMKPGDPPAGSRFTLGFSGPKYVKVFWHQEVFDTVEQLRSVADAAGRPMAELAMAWILANPAVTAPIVGADEPAHLDAAIRAADNPLEPDVKEQLDELTVRYRATDIGPPGINQ